MKTKLRRLSKRSLSMVLAVLLMISTLVIGSITTANSYSGWVIKGSLDGWSNNLASGSGSSGTAYINCSNLIGDTFEFKLICEGTYCGTSRTSAIAKGTEYSLTWNGGNNIKYNVTKGMLKINVNDTKITVQDDYAPGIKGINGDWNDNTGVTEMTHDTGNNFYYSFTGDGNDKYFRFKYGGSYYEAYDNNFNLETGDGGPYDGNTAKYGARSGDGNAFMLPSSTSYTYKIYFDSGSNDVWFTKTARTTAVTLNKQNGSGGTSSVTATYGSAMPSATMPTRTGYTFNGYFTSTGGAGTKYYNADGSSAKNWDFTDSTKTLYASWKANTYTVTYNKGSYGTGTNATDTKTYGVDLTLKDAIFTRSGYTQKGWSTAQAGTTKDYELKGTYSTNSAKTLYPYWEANTYDVTCGGSHVTYTTNPTSGTYGQTISFTVTGASSEYVVSNAPTGTYVDSNGVTQSLTIASDGNGTYHFTQPAGDVTITTIAVKTPRTVTITLDDHVHFVSATDGTTSYTLDSNNQISVSDGSTLEVTVSYDAGYEYNTASGGFTATSQYTIFTKTITTATTLNVTAKAKSYTISYNANTTMYTTTLASSAAYGSTVSFTVTPKTYYQIDSVTSSDATITKSGNTYSFTMPNKAVTVTISASETKYSVTRTAGTGGSVTTSALTAGGVTEVALGTATADDGYVFSNWEITSGTGTLTSATSSTGAKIKATSAVTVKANFTPVSHTVSYIATNATITNKTTSATVGQSVTFKVKANTGYSISGVTVSPSSGASFAATKGATDSNGYTTYSFTMPANSSASYTVGVTATATAIKPTISLKYYFEESTQTTKTTSTANITNLKTSSRKSETVTFANASSYPSGTNFTIYDGTTALYSGTTSGTTSYTDSLSAGSHTLKVTAELDGNTLTSYTITLTVYQSRTVTVKSPSYGGVIKAAYTNDFGTSTSSTPTAGNTKTIYVRNSTNITVTKSSGSGTLAEVFFNGVSKGTAAFSVTADGAVTAEFYADWYIRGFSDWGNTPDSRRFRYTDESGILALDYEFAKGTDLPAGSSGQGFKVYGNNTYYGTASTVITDKTDWIELDTTEDPNGDRNLGFKATIGGVYTFYWDTSNTNLKVEEPKSEYNITYSYTSSEADVTGPTKSINGNTVSVTIAPKSNYRLVSVEIKDVDNNTISYTNSGSTYSFEMPASNTTITVTTVRTYTVTFTKDSNITSLSLAVSNAQTGGTSGTFTSSPQTVDAGSKLVFTAAYANGYEWNSGTVGTANSTHTTFTVNSVSGNINLDLTSKKKTYALTGQVSPTGHGSVKFYSNSACTNEITTAQIGNTIYAKYIPSDDYVLKTFTVSGTGSSVGTKNGNVQTITMGYGNLTVTANVILEYSVTYYVDMHSSSVTSLTAAVVTTSGGGTIQTDSSGAKCTATLSKQGDSSVYAATINTPVTQSGSTYNPVYLKITYNGTPYVNTLASANVQTLAGSTNKEVWLEAANDPTVEKRVAYATNTTTSVTSGNKRIYVAKPYDWQTSETAWENIGLYHWGDYADMGWANAYQMHYIGHDSDYHYYYYDIPTAAKYIIFQGWGSNTSFNLQAQTEDIELSTNYYVLSHDGAYKGTAGDNVSVPAYTRYATSATLNKGDTASIAPTTSNTVKYTTTNSSVVSITTAGVVTAKASGSAIITSKILGTIGSRVYTNYPNNPDMMTRTTSVNVSDPSHFGGFNIMSLESNTSTITIPTVGSTQPGYFDDIAVTVSGLTNSGTYTNSAIITSTNKTVSVNGSNVSKPVTYTVKYAKANSTFSGYSAISVTADVVSKSIRYSGANRYGYKQWTITPSGDTVPTATTKVDGGIETATTKGITLLGKTYSEVFETYPYVDVTFTFNYYTYKTKRTVFKLDDEGNKIPKRDSEGAIIEGEYETEEKEFYQYDADYIDPDKHGVAGYSTANDAENRNSSNFNASKHELATYTVTDFEVRGKTSANITAADLYNYTYNSKTVTPALNAIADMPDNNYYSYRLNASTIKTPTANGTYKANVTVELLHAPKKYIVKLDGNNVTNGNDGSRNLNTNYYFYQEYATLSSGNNTNWCVTDASNSTTGTPLANGKSYKFRVAGNTYIKGVAASIADADFNRSKVTNAGQQITHEEKSSTNHTIVEKLTNNFYISDFFVPEFVKNERNVQEDDVKFVGGGVVYYQVKDGVVDSKVEDAGYADSSGVGVKSSIADFIQEKIESASVPNEIQGDDLRNEIAYGTEIAAKADSETGLRYRYLPYNVFTRDNGVLSTGLKDEVSGNVLVQQLDSNNNPVTRTVDGKNVPVYYTFATETSSNTFRYSNTLRAYQYIYADKKENKATNAGKNMRLYAYYIYSYTEYDKDTGIPSTVYKVVLSDEYADASTYWNNTNTNN